MLTEWNSSRTSNLRNVWSLAYCFFNSPDFKDIFSKAGPQYFAQRFGDQAGVAVQERRFLVEHTKQLPNNSTYAQGVPDYVFPPYNSWVRFTFGVKGRWEGARQKRTNVSEVNYTSDDPWVQPPLSPDELDFQCGSKEPCKLRWIVGTNRYYTAEAKLGSQPGYQGHADMAGYRTIAGPSGTTSNVMQMARMLGFWGEDLVSLRAAMVAWMVPKDDHSFFEIMLGAEPFMPVGFGMALGREDLGQLWPRDIFVSWQDGAFTTKAVWAAVAERLQDNKTQALLKRMGADDVAYIRGLISQNADDDVSFLV